MNNCIKVSHTTKVRAIKAAYAIKAKGCIPARAALEAYFCKSCNAWHLSRIDALAFLNKISKNEGKRLKKLVNETPADMTTEAFDELHVLITSNGDFHKPTVEASGVVNFSETCDEEGKPTGEPSSDLYVFCLIAENDMIETEPVEA